MASMTRFCLALCFLAVSFCGAATAANAADTERVLFPVWTDLPVAGALGSTWVATAKINNPESAAIGVYPVILESGRQTGAIAPHTTWTMAFFPDTVFGIGNGGADDIAGRIAYVDRSRADQLVYMDRLCDATQSPAYAVDIPVVRERDLRTSPMTLAQVPFDPRVRLMLRIYDPFQTAGGEVIVQFWSEWPVSNAGAGAFATPPPPQLLGSVNVKLHTAARPPQAGDFDVEPAYAQLPITADMLSNIPAYSGGSFSVQVEPVTPGLRFWAFVSVTDNATQHVLVIAPH